LKNFGDVLAFEPIRIGVDLVEFYDFRDAAEAHEQLNHLCLQVSFCFNATLMLGIVFDGIVLFAAITGRSCPGNGAVFGFNQFGVESHT
jgi:hypothetical protein